MCRNALSNKLYPSSHCVPEPVHFVNDAKLATAAAAAQHRKQLNDKNLPRIILSSFRLIKSDQDRVVYINNGEVGGGGAGGEDVCLITREKKFLLWR